MRCRKNIHSVSRLGKESKLSLLSLLTELYNFYFCVVSLSQNAHPVVFNGRRLPKRRPSKKLKRFVLVTQYIYNIYTYCFSYYFFSVYVSLSKNSFWGCFSGLSLKAEAKVRFLSESTNFFEEKIQLLCKKNWRLDFRQVSNPLYLYYILYRHYFSSGA